MHSQTFPQTAPPTIPPDLAAHYADHCQEEPGCDYCAVLARLDDRFARFDAGELWPVELGGEG